MRRLIASLVALALVAAAFMAVAASGATTKNVNVNDDYFSRAGKRNPTVTIRPNDKVRWNWRGLNEHNVAVAIGRRTYRSPVQTSGTYPKRFTRVGRFTAICEIHPSTMRMTVRVRR